MEPNGPVRVRLVPFVHSQSYKQIRVHLDPNIHHLAGYPLGLPQGPLGVPGPHFENRGFNADGISILMQMTVPFSSSVE